MTARTERTFLPVFLALKHRFDAHVIADRLFIEEVEYGIAFDHVRQGILQRFGRPDAAPVDQVKQVAPFRFFRDVFLDEGRELPVFIADEERGRRVPFLVNVR